MNGTTQLRIGTVVGAVTAMAVLPRVYVAAQALLELAHVKAGPYVFIDFEPVLWVRIAFLAAHAWLAWALWARPRHRASWAFGMCMVVVTTELAVVYGFTGFLRLRGFSLCVF